jgi:hypothetical protein
MKKDQPRQDRRARALARFTTKPAPTPDDGTHAKYLERKAVELASLKRTLGVA